MRTVWVLIGAIIFLWLVSSYIFMSRVEDAGGFRQIIVDAGKEVKSIYNEINEETEQ